MSRTYEGKISSTIIQRLNAARMSDAERQTAISAMHNAEMLADTLQWVARKVEQLGARLFLKPNLKH